MKNILSLILRYFSFLLCGLLLSAAIYYLYLIDRTVVLAGFSRTVTTPYPPPSAVFPIIPAAAAPLSILACFILCLSFAGKERVRFGEGICAVAFHVATWFVLLPACFQFPVVSSSKIPQRPLIAGYFRPADPGEVRFYTNVNPDRGFVLNTLTGDARRVTSFDETGETAIPNEIAETGDTISPFSDPLVGERLRPPSWLTAFLSLLTTLFRRLRAGYLAGTYPWLFSAAPCFPLSALAVISHLGRRRFSNVCRVVLAFLLILGVNIAWTYLGMDVFFSPEADALVAFLAPAALEQNGTLFVPLATVNLLLALALYCCGLFGAIANHRQKNAPWAFSSGVFP